MYGDCYWIVHLVSCWHTALSSCSSLVMYCSLIDHYHHHYCDPSSSFLTGGHFFADSHKQGPFCNWHLPSYPCISVRLIALSWLWVPCCESHCLLAAFLLVGQIRWLLSFGLSKTWEPICSHPIFSSSWCSLPRVTCVPILFVSITRVYPIVSQRVSSDSSCRSVVYEWVLTPAMTAS